MSNQPTIGQMYQSVKFQYYTLDKKANGEEAPLWHDYATVKAEVDITAVSEREQNNRLANTENIDFNIRTLIGINTKMRVIHDSKVYQIMGIMQITRRYQKIKAHLSLDYTDEYLASQADVTADNVDVSSDKVNI